MPIRITGMYSGLDTESIIQELASAKQYKVTQLQKAQTTLGWKQDAWKALNTKIYSFYTQTLDDMRWTTSYAKKMVTCSNSNAVSIVASDSAPYSTQSLKVKQLAKSGYMTGGEVTKADGTGGIDGNTKMSDLGITGSTKIYISVGTGGTPEEIDVGADQTINDVVKQLQAAGVNANFDEKNQRFYISSTDTGSDKDFAFSGDTTALESLGFGSTAHKVAASDAIIELNGVDYTSSNNVFEINGLTITAKETTENEMSITTQADTSGIFDMVKNFFKGYNELINEMDKLYNADSSKGYEPLTDDEKSAMSDSEVEKWEQKIKDAVLRKDSTLDSVAGAMKEVMAQGFTVNGKTMYLFDFGIETLGYFSAAENERNAYHIDGDSDDASTRGNENKLMAAIMADPDAVTSFFTQLANKLSTTLFDKMKSIDGVSSAFTVYEDKLLQEEYDDYTTKIAEQQKKVDAFMERYYAKFSAMETALATLESKSNAVAQLLGM